MKCSNKFRAARVGSLQVMASTQAHKSLPPAMQAIEEVLRLKTHGERERETERERERERSIDIERSIKL